MDCTTKPDPAQVSQTRNRGETMVEPEEVAAVVRLHELGWGARRIAAELGIARNTVKRYLRQGGWRPYRRPRRAGILEGREEWLSRKFFEHAGNADVLRQQLAELGIAVSLRTVERAVKPLRQALEAEAKATIRFETPPGKQLQIDFGSRLVTIAGEPVKLHLFVATLGYSRRRYVAVFRHERLSAWLCGIEGALRHFGGVVLEILIDNPRALVKEHDVENGRLEFTDRFLAFCRYWDVIPRACAPYRARTKGKDERSVGYVKNNAIAGRTFQSIEHLEQHLAWWMREVADARIHGTTGEAPAVRFERDERLKLRDLAGRPPFEQVRELRRKVSNDCFVDVDTNRYSVPWTLLGQEVTVQIADGQVVVFLADALIARHIEVEGSRRMVRDPAHFRGLAGGPARLRGQTEMPLTLAEPALLRPLDVYEEIAGGRW